MGEREYFKEFCDNLAISTSKRAVISTRYKAITRRLNADFWGEPHDSLFSRYVGSFGRKTSINNESDIDMVFVLPDFLKSKYDAYSYNGQSALLQSVRNSLLKTYSSSKVGADGQVVAIPFYDNINFEVVPAFEDDKKFYTYPDANNNGSWKVSKPHLEIDKVARADAQLNYNLKRLCKMTRAWKGFCNVPMNGLLIDTLAYNFLKDWAFRDKSYFYYDLMMRDFFAYLKGQNQNQKYWFALGSFQFVYRKGIFEYKALLAYNKAVNAIELQKKGQYWSAKQKWREIFGYEFPS